MWQSYGKHTFCGDDMIGINNPSRWDVNYPPVMTNSLLLKMAIEIVDLPSNSMVIFHSFVTVYQRVCFIFYPGFHGFSKNARVIQRHRIGRAGMFRRMFLIDPTP
jgi:hypothetical protein